MKIKIRGKTKRKNKGISMLTFSEALLFFVELIPNDFKV